MQSLHPLTVHFPIALLITGVALDLLGWIAKRPALRTAALWNLSLGTLGAGAAVWTGLRAENVAKHSFEIWKVLELHKKLGISTLILGLLGLGWRWQQRRRLTGWRQAVASLLALGMLGTLIWGAHLGGDLVYELGVGGQFGRK